MNGGGGEEGWIVVFREVWFYKRFNGVFIF